MDPSVMIFAAGRGTRMAPLTNDTPKPMVLVNGRPMIDYALDLVADAGLTRVFANTHYLPETLESHLHTRGVTPIREDVLLETGGGLRNALPFLGDGPVVVINADAIWLGANPIWDLMRHWQTDMGALLSLTHPKDALGHDRGGDFVQGPDGRISRGPELVYNGVHITRTDQLADIPDAAFSLNRLWDLMLDQGTLFGLERAGAWCDVGRPESIALAEDALNG